MSKDEFRGDLIHHKTMAELHFVVSLYANTDMSEEYKVEPMKVFSNQHWLIYYGILSAMIEKKKVSEIDQINIEMYISEQGEKLRAMYEKAGGWHTIEEAKQMIRQEQANFTEISDALGYTSIHYFSRQFKTFTGMSPSEYALSIKALSEEDAANALH